MSHIPMNVTRLAAGILEQQDSVPVSPAEKLSDGRVNLCLAAAIAVAGYEARGLHANAEELVNRLAKTQSREPVRHAFQTLGWTVSDCDMRMAQNDSAPSETRKAVVLSHLQASL